MSLLSKTHMTGAAPAVAAPAALPPDPFPPPPQTAALPTDAPTDEDEEEADSDQDWVARAPQPAPTTAVAAAFPPPFPVDEDWIFSDRTAPAARPPPATAALPTAAAAAPTDEDEDATAEEDEDSDEDANANTDAEEEDEEEDAEEDSDEDVVPPPPPAAHLPSPSLLPPPAPVVVAPAVPQYVIPPEFKCGDIATPGSWNIVRLIGGRPNTTASSSDIWIVEMAENGGGGRTEEAVLKIFVVRNGRTDGMSDSTKRMIFEGFLMTNIINRIVSQSISPHFIVTRRFSDGCSAEYLVNLVAEFHQTRHPQREFAERLFARNISYMLRLTPGTRPSITDDSIPGAATAVMSGVNINENTYGYIATQMSGVDTMSLYEWLGTVIVNGHTNRLNDILIVAFQVWTAICAMAASGVQHNDLHLGNILITRLPYRRTYLYHEIARNKKVIAIETNLDVKIFDFDRATQVGTPNMLFSRTLEGYGVTNHFYNGKLDMAKFASVLGFRMIRGLGLRDEVYRNAVKEFAKSIAPNPELGAKVFIAIENTAEMTQFVLDGDPIALKTAIDMRNPRPRISELETPIESLRKFHRYLRVATARGEFTYSVISQESAQQMVDGAARTGAAIVESFPVRKIFRTLNISAKHVPVRRLQVSDDYSSDDDDEPDRKIARRAGDDDVAAGHRRQAAFAAAAEAVRAAAEAVRPAAARPPPDGPPGAAARRRRTRFTAPDKTAIARDRRAYYQSTVVAR